MGHLQNRLRPTGVSSDAMPGHGEAQNENISPEKGDLLVVDQSLQDQLNDSNAA